MFSDQKWGSSVLCFFRSGQTQSQRTILTFEILSKFPPLYFDSCTNSWKTLKQEKANIYGCFSCKITTAFRPSLSLYEIEVSTFIRRWLRVPRSDSKQNVLQLQRKASMVRRKRQSLLVSSVAVMMSTWGRCHWIHILKIILLCSFLSSKSSFPRFTVQQLLSGSPIPETEKEVRSYCAFGSRPCAKNPRPYFFIFFARFGCISKTFFSKRLWLGA